jgi:hypothetical protein
LTQARSIKTLFVFADSRCHASRRVCKNVAIGVPELPPNTHHGPQDIENALIEHLRNVEAHVAG